MEMKYKFRALVNVVVAHKSGFKDAAAFNRFVADLADTLEKLYKTFDKATFIEGVVQRERVEAQARDLVADYTARTVSKS